ncbi:MAG: hypothetical protein HQL88_03800 [Magnetococcales bacterium]|nr:hypothetical protein [Magnetococcales bacterium]
MMQFATSRARFLLLSTIMVLVAIVMMVVMLLPLHEHAMIKEGERLSAVARNHARTLSTFFNLGQQGQTAKRRPAQKPKRSEPQIAHSQKHVAKALPLPGRKSTGMVAHKSAGVEMKRAHSDEEFENF